jgi:hypothetical protein
MPPLLSKVAKDYRRSAINRFDEAVLLETAGKCTGAMYLAGYAVECMLKVLILSTVPLHQQAELAAREFRGSDGHDFEILRTKYFKRRGARFPPETAKLFTLVSDWSTNLRYDPRESKNAEAERFLSAVEGIIAWAKGRL